MVGPSVPWRPPLSRHRSHRRARRVLLRLGSAGLLVASATLVAATAAPPLASAAGQSISTTTNVAASTGNGTCLHPGSVTDPTNCNAYTSREDVWLSNLPQGLPDGDYFFAVSVPGTQADPNDGAAGLLSTDSHLDRSFRIDNGTVVALGTHLVENQRLQLFPFADTTNGGGVYIASVCSLADYPVSGSDCTHDAFKVGPDDPDVAFAPTVLKDAAGDYTRTYAWTVDKVADQTTVQGTSGSATVTYTVTVGHDDGTVSGVVVGGTITVFNPNADPLVADVTDQLSDGTVCAVTGGDDALLQPGDNDFAYTCALASLPQAQLDNTATATWADQAVGNAQLAAGTADFLFSDVSFTAALVDDCSAVTDTWAGALGTVCVGDANPTAYQYQRTFAFDTPGCVVHPNTATATADDSGTPTSDSADVTVCKIPLATGAHTIGFWSNKNGQGVIKGGAAPGGVCASGTYLRTYAPFKDLASGASCSAVASYVATVIAKATASTMNPMLKAQMLATALDVWFTGPGSTAASQKFLPHSNLGGTVIDLTHVKGTDVSGAFGGATSLTVSQMLTYAASKSNVGGSTWYANVKATQTKAKDAFDAINNQAAYGP